MNMISALHVTIYTCFTQWQSKTEIHPLLGYATLSCHQYVGILYDLHLHSLTLTMHTHTHILTTYTHTHTLTVHKHTHPELYWEAMSRLKWPTTDDQGNVNLALDKLDIRWMNFKPTQNIDTFEHEIYGVCRNKMIVMLMPFNVVCRHTCSAARREEYYVWHALAIKENRTVENKMSQARVGGAWFLSENWMTLSSQVEGLKGPEWLQHIADPAVINSRQKQ